MTILVTGATGFIGRRLIARLVAEGVNVRATLHRTPPPPHATAGVTWRSLPDLCNSTTWDEMLDGVDSVIHLAALAHQIGRAGSGRWEEFRRTNVEGTGVLAAACGRAGVRRLVFLSSVAASQWPPAAECAPNSLTDYGRSKQEAERAIEQRLQLAATDWCILRPPLIYGPGNPGNMARLMRLIQTGIPLPFASIRNVRSFLFVDNLVDAIVTVVRFARPIRGTFTVSDGTDISTPDLVRALAKCSGRHVHLFPVPMRLLRLLGRIADVAGSALHRSLPFDSYSIDKLLSSSLANGAVFRDTFAWHPPISSERALAATCQDILAETAR